MKKILFTATGLIVALNILDIITTLYVLGHGGVEANPLSLFLLNHHLLWPVKILLPLSILFTTWLRRNVPVTRQNMYAACIVAAVYVCVIGWNTSRVLVHMGVL